MKCGLGDLSDSVRAVILHTRLGQDLEVLLELYREFHQDNGTLALDWVR